MAYDSSCTSNSWSTQNPVCKPCPPTGLADAELCRLAESSNNDLYSGRDCQGKCPYSKIKIFPETSPPSATQDLDRASDDPEGQSYQPTRAETRAIHTPNTQHQSAMIANIAFPFSHYTNSRLLPTITEQGSSLGLRSRVPRLDANRQYSTAAMCNGLLECDDKLDRQPSNMDESGQQDGQEKQCPEKNIDSSISPYASPQHTHGMSDVPCDVAHPSTHLTAEHEPLQACQNPEQGSKQGGKRVKALFRGVIQHFRGAFQRNESPSCARSSPFDRLRTKQTSTIREGGHGGPCAGGSALQCRMQSNSVHTIDDLKKTTSPFPEPILSARVRSRESVSKPIRPWRAPGCPQPEGLTKLSRHESVAAHNSRHTLQKEVLAPACTAKFHSDCCYNNFYLMEYTNTQPIKDSSFETRTADTLDNHSQNHSFHERTCTREENAEGSISTSYSGPVLGIDLDLRQDALVPASSEAAGRLTRRQTSESETTRHRSSQTLPTQQQDQATTKSLHPYPTQSSQGYSHTVVSSALPVLLPLAVASGIVKVNKTTTHRSFLSPSGNLIEADTQFRRNSYAARTVYCPAVSYSEPSVRPVFLLSRTASDATPSSYRRSNILRYRHPNQKHSISVQNRSHSVSSPKLNVFGHDGAFERRRLSPKRYSLESDQQNNGSGRGTRLHERFTKTTRSRFPAVASCRRLPNRREESQHRVPDPMLGFYTKNQVVDSPGWPELGPAIGHILRICFCQPEDGVVKE